MWNRTLSAGGDGAVHVQETSLADARDHVGRSHRAVASARASVTTTAKVPTSAASTHTVVADRVNVPLT